MKRAVNIITNLSLLIAVALTVVSIVELNFEKEYRNNNSEYNYYSDKIKYNYSENDIKEIKKSIKAFNDIIENGYNNQLEECKVSEDIKEYFKEKKETNVVKTSGNDIINLCSDNLVIVTLKNDSNTIYKITYNKGKMQSIMEYE